MRRQVALFPAKKVADLELNYVDEEEPIVHSRRQGENVALVSRKVLFYDNRTPGNVSSKIIKLIEKFYKRKLVAFS